MGRHIRYDDARPVMVPGTLEALQPPFRVEEQGAFLECPVPKISGPTSVSVVEEEEGTKCWVKPGNILSILPGIHEKEGLWGNRYGFFSPIKNLFISVSQKAGIRRVRPPDIHLPRQGPPVLLPPGGVARAAEGDGGGRGHTVRPSRRGRRDQKSNYFW